MIRIGLLVAALSLVGCGSVDPMQVDAQADAIMVDAAPDAGLDAMFARDSSEPDALCGLFHGQCCNLSGPPQDRTCLEQYAICSGGTCIQCGATAGELCCAGRHCAALGGPNGETPLLCDPATIYCTDCGVAGLRCCASDTQHPPCHDGSACVSGMCQF